MAEEEDPELAAKLAARQRMLEMRKTAKALKGKDPKSKLPAIAKCDEDHAYITEGECMQPLIDALVPKKKSGPVIEAAAKCLLGFFTSEDEPDPQGVLYRNALLMLSKTKQKKKALKFSGKLLTGVLTHPKPGVPVAALDCYDKVVQAVQSLEAAANAELPEGAEKPDLPFDPNLLPHFRKVLTADPNAPDKLSALLERVVEARAYVPPAPTPPPEPMEEGEELSPEAQAEAEAAAAAAAAAKEAAAASAPPPPPPPPQELVEAAPRTIVQCMQHMRLFIATKPTESVQMICKRPATLEALLLCVADDPAMRREAAPLLVQLCENNATAARLIAQFAAPKAIEQLASVLEALLALESKTAEDEEHVHLVLNLMRMIADEVRPSVALPPQETAQEPDEAAAEERVEALVPRRQPADFLTFVPGLKCLLALPINEGDALAHAEAVRVVSAMTRQDDGMRQALCDSMMIEALLQLLQATAVVDGSQPAELVSQLRRAIEKTCFELVCTLPHTGSKQVVPGLLSVGEVDEAPILVPTLLAMLASPDADLKHRTLRFTARVLEAAENAQAVGAVAVDPLVSLLTAWQVTEPPSLEVEAADTSAVTHNAQLVHCCQCLLALAEQSIEACTAIGQADTIKTVTKVLSAAPLTTKAFEDAVSAGGEGLGDIDGFDEPSTRTDHGEPMCFTDCPEEWKWDTLGKALPPPSPSDELGEGEGTGTEEVAAEALAAREETKAAEEPTVPPAEAAAAGPAEPGAEDGQPEPTEAQRPPSRPTTAMRALAERQPARVYLRAEAAALLRVLAEGVHRFAEGAEEHTTTALQVTADSVADEASAPCLRLLCVDVDFKSTAAFWGSFRQEPFVCSSVKLSVLGLFRAIAATGGTFKLVAAADDHLPRRCVVGEEDAPSPSSKGVPIAAEGTGGWTPPDHFMVYDFVHSTDSACEDAWPLIVTLSGVLALLFDPEASSAALCGALTAIKALCWDQTRPPEKQSARRDTIAAVAVSMGVLVPLVSLRNAIDSTSNPTLLEDIASLSEFMISRGISREEYWTAAVAEYQQLAAEVEKRNNEKLAENPKAKDLEQLPDPPVTGDPNRGPTIAQWRTMLNVPVDDQRNGQSKVTPLLAAQNSGISSIVRALLKAGADINVADSEGSSPLMRALGQGNQKAVESLLESGADVDSMDVQGVNVLKLAFAAPTPEQVDAVHVPSTELEAESVALDEAVTNSNVPPVLNADGELELEGNPYLLPMLLSAGADPNVSDNDGRYPLHWALAGTCVRSKIKSVPVKLASPPLLQLGPDESALARLVQSGADVNVCDKLGDTPLHTALKLGATAAAHFLLDAGADPNLANQQGVLPLHLAIAVDARDVQSRRELVVRLLSAGAGRPMAVAEHCDKRKRRSAKDKVALDVAELLDWSLADASTPRSITAVPASAADLLNATTQDGWSALHLACGAPLPAPPETAPVDEPPPVDEGAPPGKVQQLQVLGALLGQSGLDLDACAANHSRQTALHVLLDSWPRSTRGFTEWDIVEHVNALLGAGANPDSTFIDVGASGLTLSAVHLAVRSNATVLASALLAGGAKSFPDCSVPPLHMVAANPTLNASLVGLLVAGGPRAQINDAVVAEVDGFELRGTPLHIAAVTNNGLAVKALLAQKPDVDPTLTPPEALGRTPLQAACTIARPGCPAAVAALLAHSMVDPAAQDASGKCPLELAVRANSAEVVEALLAVLSPADLQGVLVQRSGRSNAALLFLAEQLNSEQWFPTSEITATTFDPSDDLIASDRIVEVLLAAAAPAVSGGLLPTDHFSEGYATGRFPSRVAQEEADFAAQVQAEHDAATQLQCKVRMDQAKVKVERQRRAQRKARRSSTKKTAP